MNILPRLPALNKYRWVTITCFCLAVLIVIVKSLNFENESPVAYKITVGIPVVIGVIAYVKGHRGDYNKL